MAEVRLHRHYRDTETVLMDLFNVIEQYDGSLRLHLRSQAHSIVSEDCEIVFYNHEVDCFKGLGGMKKGMLCEVNEWISVKQEVPEYGKRVLLYMKAPTWGDKQIHIGCRTHTDQSGDHWNVDYGHYISHWMPLPEPPKEYVEKYVSSLRVPYTSCKGPDGEGPGSRE